MNRKSMSLTAVLAALAIVFFTGQAKAQTSSDANAQQMQNTQQQQMVIGGSPNQSITFEGSTNPAQPAYPRTISPYSPANQINHPGYWIAVTKGGLLQPQHNTLAERRIWTLADAMAMSNCIERSEGEIKTLFDIRSVSFGPAEASSRTMQYIDNYEANDQAEFLRCFRLVGKFNTMGIQGKKLVKKEKPVSSEEACGRALTAAFEKGKGNFFMLEAEGAPMQMNADTSQLDLGFSIGNVSGPGSGSTGAFIGGLWHSSQGASWPLQVPFLRIVTYESTGKAYVPRSVREARAKAEADKKAAREAMLKKISAGEDDVQENVVSVKSSVRGKEPSTKPDPRIIRNGGGIR